MKYFFLLFFITTLAGCTHSNVPDVSGIKIDVKVQRFEKDFFAIDTTRVLQEMERLRGSYPNFVNDFMNQIMGFTSRSSPDSVSKYVYLFIRDYRFVKDSAELLYSNFEPIAAEVRKGLQYVKYYFPNYKTPGKIITFIGPFDGYSDVLTSDALAIGLQLHMGKNFSFYKSEIANDLFPQYITERFSKEYIPVNCMRNIIDDLYPDKSTGKALIEQIVEKGKRLYLLDKLLPATPEYMKIGYLDKQLQDCYKHETEIWSFFLTNNLLNVADQNIVKNYIGDSPKTQEFGDDSPGNIGSFSGWQIIRKYIAKFPSTSISDLMQKDPREIYSASRYKP